MCPLGATIPLSQPFVTVGLAGILVPNVDIVSVAGSNSKTLPWSIGVKYIFPLGCATAPPYDWLFSETPLTLIVVAVLPTVSIFKILFEPYGAP